MEELFVTVIMPVLNGQQFIERTLDSVLGQTYRPLEIVVVDDGSVDQTPAIVEAAAVRDSRIRFFRRPHFGLPATRNFAISQARGNLIAPLDADDLWHPEKIAQQVQVMRASSPMVGVVYCWTVEIDENDLITAPIRNKCVAQGHVVAELAGAGNFLESASVPLIRRSFIDAVGGYDESMVKGSEDWKLNLALAEICEFAVMPAHLVGYRRSSTNMSKNVKAMEQSIDHVENWIMDKWPDLPAKVKRRMFYNSNYYLAYQALSTNNLIMAASYKLKSLKAEPLALPTSSNLMFWIRILARLFGIRKANLPVQPRRIPFKEFRPKLQF